MQSDIRSQNKDELSAQLRAWGAPAFRATQLLEWLYRHRVTNWDAMTNLPASFRQQLKTHYSFHSLKLVRKQGSLDTTQKFLWRLSDHSLIESVLIPANPALYGEPSDRHTLCISTQVGCAYACKFCASGLEGLKRNLRPEEIVGQVIEIEKEAQQVNVAQTATKLPDPSDHTSNAEPSRSSRKISPSTPGEPRFISNLVIMGMGEPLANYDNLLKALKILNAPWGAGIGARKITISTSGLAPQIRKLADEPLQFRLAISLHGATDETRNQIMPVNRKYPLRELTAACEYYQAKKGRMITFEYILIAGINDGRDQVKPLAALARRLNAKVNLIPYNSVEGLPWHRPDEASQERFASSLQKEKVLATLRREKGHDIDAACGQLRLRTERELQVAAQ